MASESTETRKVDGGSENGEVSHEDIRRELEEQFNVQRARMKELFLQKEEDMQRILQEKQQLESEVLGLRAELQQLTILSGNQQSEIQNLQLLVSETVEASSSGVAEVRRMRARCADLEHQLALVRQQLQQREQEVSLAPGTLVRSLARRLGADTEVEHHQPRKAVEEGESLDLEIAVLKNKLRDTDAQLQEALKNKAPCNTPGEKGEIKADTESRQCDMCINYEKQLVAEQAQAEAARERANKLDHALKLATEELESVRSLHDETVRSWQSDRSASGAQLETLREALTTAKATLDERIAQAQEAERKALEHITMITVDRETLQKKLDTLERDNAALIGQYSKMAAEMQNEVIDLPDNVEELQELTLHLREQLITSALGRERAIQSEQELRNQLLQHSQLFNQQEVELQRTRAQLKEARDELEQLQTEREQMGELADKLRHSTDMIESLLEDKKRLQGETQELRGRVSVLQQELDNSEKVQQDFVRLSQSLQVQLQRIREADTEVRWQHDDDVTHCPACHQALPNNKKKVHCRHCGRIFCAGCVAHTVPAGPRGVPARVCAVCRTLLQPDTAPYFSTQPPHTPD